MGARAVAWVAFLVLAGAAAPAQADAPAQDKAAGTAPAATQAGKRLPIRLAMSPAAAEYLTEIRVRKLVEIELRGAAYLAPTLGGPLDEQWIGVWIDLPDPSVVLIQVEARDRPLIQRRVKISGLPWDVSARFVAIATSESIRRQLRPKAERPPPKPRGPTAEERLRARRAAPSAVVRAMGSAALLPGGGAWLVGPSLSASSQAGGLTQTLEARWMAGDSDAGRMRWFEGGAGADYRFWLGDDLRLTFGGSAGLAAIALSDQQEVRDGTEESETWSARATLTLGAEARLSDSAWLALRAEPGAVLREIPFDGGDRALDGAWLGLSLGIVVDEPLPIFGKD